MSPEDDPKLVQLNIEVSAANTTEEDADQLARQLLSELRETDVESAVLTKGSPPPADSKGDPIAIGTIALEVLPAILPRVIGVVQAWVSRGQGHTVKFKGKGIEFEGSPPELQRLLEKLSAHSHHLPGDSTTDAPPPKKK